MRYVMSCEWTQDLSSVGSEPPIFGVSGFSEDLYPYHHNRIHLKDKANAATCDVTLTFEL